MNHHVTIDRFLVRNILLILEDVSEMSGRDLHNHLNGKLRWWQRWSGPAFYSKMGQLSDEKMVVSRIITKTIMDQTIKEALYSITDKGRDFLGELVKTKDA